MNTIDKYLAEFQKLETQEEIDKFTEKIKKEQSQRTEAEKEEISKQFVSSVENSIAEAEDLIDYLSIKEQLECVLPYISIATIAKNYFGKSRNWLYQKLNGNIVNGKVAHFTEEEKKTLKFALESIAKELQEASFKIVIA